jgi:hypothetical protein
MLIPIFSPLANLAAGPISFIGISQASGTSVAIPTHQIGDLILIFCNVTGVDTTTPSTGAGFTSIASGSWAADDEWAFNLGYKIATDSSTTSGTWSGTGTEYMAALVYRGVSGIGAVGTINVDLDVDLDVEWNSLTLQNTDNTSWIVGFGAAESTPNFTNVPSTRTQRALQTHKVIWDSNGTVSSCSSQTSSKDDDRGSSTVIIELKT